MSNITCPPDGQLPSFHSLPIPSNVNAILLSGKNVSDTVIDTCCSPSSVNLVNWCYLWCEAPAQYLNGSGQDDSAVTTAFSNCLSRNGEPKTIVAFQRSSATVVRLDSPAKLFMLCLLGSIILML